MSDEALPSTDLLSWAVKLSEKYGSEAQERLATCWDGHEGFVGYGYFESCLAYAMIREAQPKVVFEISPAEGWSTYPLACAVKENGLGKIHSFELDGEFVKTYKKNMARCGLSEVTEIHEGDAKETVPKVLAELGYIDILFMDCDHSDTGAHPFHSQYSALSSVYGGKLAKWYTETLIPITKRWVQIHDFTYLWDYGEIKVVRDWLKNHPEAEWSRSRDIFERSVFKTREEYRGEANSSIWIKMEDELKRVK